MNLLQLFSLPPSDFLSLFPLDSITSSQPRGPFCLPPIPHLAAYGDRLQGALLCHETCYCVQATPALIKEELPSAKCQQGCPGGSEVKNMPGNAGDAGSIPGLGRSLGVGNGSPLQYSCLENPTEEPGGPQSRKESNRTERLSTHTHTRKCPQQQQSNVSRAEAGETWIRDHLLPYLALCSPCSRAFSRRT